MKERSTQAVVGLWGNESTMTRGLGHDSSQACIKPSKKSSPGSGAAGPVDVDRGAPERHLAHVGAGEERAPDVDRVRRGGHQCGVPGLRRAPT